MVPIHDYGEIDGRLFVSMRLINGRDLDTVLAEGPLDPARAVRIIDQVAKALHAAHKAGLIHRDIKPSNILLDDDDFAYLIDFGIARVTDETRLTKTGNTIGTFAYIAPERLDPHIDEDGRVDIYSLACVLYQALTGQPPFAGSTTAHLIAAHLNTAPPRPSTTQPQVPPQVDEVIATGMAKDPDQRYATTVELANAARDAITAPIARAAPAPAQLAATQQAGNRGTAQPMTAKAEPTPAKPPPPPQPAPPTPARAGGIGRRTTIALVAGAIALIAVIAAVIGIPALVKHEPSHPSPTSSLPSASAARSYGAQVKLPLTGLGFPAGVAVDSAGNVYVTDANPAIRQSRVLRLSAGSATQDVLPFTDLGNATGVAVDSAGTLYIIDSANGRVLKLAAGSATQDVLPFTGLNGPVGVAVDSVGTLYVSDSYNNRVLKLTAGSATQDVLPFTGLLHPYAVAVDTAGTLYVTDERNGVLKLAAASSKQEVLPFTGLKGPNSLAVANTGILYVTDYGNHRVLKLAAGSATQEVLPFTGLDAPRRCGGGQHRRPLCHRRRQQPVGAETAGAVRPQRLRTSRSPQNQTRVLARRVPR